MKVIFLDFNGVLDTHIKMDVVDYENLQRFKKIYSDTSADGVVITASCKNTYFYSGGRHNKIFLYLVDMLSSNGINILGFTDMKDSREEEIIEYLKFHPEIDNYVILDDDYEMPLLSDHLVKLPSQMEPDQMGLDNYYMNKAIDILGVEKVEQKKLRKIPR